MKNYKSISKGIYKKEGELTVDQDFKERLYLAAKGHPRNRSRILIHESVDSIPQEMVIAFTDKSIVEVSTHIFPESFTLLEGVAKYIFFDDKGNNIGDIMLSTYQNFGSFYCFIPKNTFHRFIPYSSNSLAHEVGFSNFSSDYTSLYLENQFKEISSRSNKNYSLEPRNLKLKTNYICKDSPEILEVSITGEIIYLSYQIIEKTKSAFKPTLYKINASLPLNINEFFLVLLPHSQFEIPHQYCVKSMSLIIGSVNILLSNKIYIKLNKKKDCFFACNKDESCIKIENIYSELVIVKFTSVN